MSSYGPDYKGVEFCIASSSTHSTNLLQADQSRSWTEQRARTNDLQGLAQTDRRSSTDSGTRSRTKEQLIPPINHINQQLYLHPKRNAALKRYIKL